MICYKDMTFCNYYKDCRMGNKCHRACTEEVLEAADKWWGKPGAPVCVFAKKPDNCKLITEIVFTEDE